MKYRHVLAVTLFGPCTFAIDPLWRNVNYGFTNEVHITDYIIALREKGLDIIWLKNWKPDAERAPIRSPFMTCASLIAYTCGIPTRAITPDGLYRKLIKMGGKVLP